MHKVSTTHKLLALIASGHIALCPQGLAASKNISTSYSTPTEKLNFFSDNYLNAQNSSREKVVVVSGFGVDADSATSNAAENALNQLVGSIVTSETLVKKRTEIRNGIAGQVKTIKKEITDYSQGYIKSINILDMQKKGDIFVVTIRANIRIDDFTKFVKNLAKSEQKIDGGIFAAITTNRSNRSTKKDALFGLLQVIARGEAHDITVGDAFQAGEKFYNYFSGNYLDTIVVPVDISLRADFYKKLIKTIESLSSKKEESLVRKQYHGGLSDFQIRARKEFGNSEESTAFYAEISSGSGTSWKSAKYYMPGLRANNEYISQSLLPEEFYSKLKISFLDFTGSSVLEYRFSHDPYMPTKTITTKRSEDRKLKIFRPFFSTPNEFLLPIEGDTYIKSVWQLISTRGKTIHLSTKLRFYIAVELSDEEMRSIKRISVQIEN